MALGWAARVVHRVGLRALLRHRVRPVTFVMPHVEVWRSVRAGEDTKRRKSRRTIALPKRCVEALRAHREHQQAARAVAGDRWVDHDLVLASEVGTSLDPANVRRGFRRVAREAGLGAQSWTPRELRHSFVSLLSDHGVSIEQIARLVGHAGGSTVTEAVYRKHTRAQPERPYGLILSSRRSR